MKELKSIDALSAAKMGGLLGLAGGAIKSVFMLTFIGSMMPMMSSWGGPWSMMGGWSAPSFAVSMVLMALIGGAIWGFVGGAVFAWLYNFFAKRWGGLKLGL